MRMIPIAVLFMFAAGVCLAAQSTGRRSVRRDRRIQPAHPNSERTGTHCSSKQSGTSWSVIWKPLGKGERAETSSPEEDSISMCILP
jgi:hypothetical protein